MTVSSSILSRWYTQLASLLEAGIALERAATSTPGPPVALRERFCEQLRAGESVDDALEKGAAWLPLTDRRLIAAGADSGRLPEMFRRLAIKHEDANRARRLAIVSSLYPLAILHFAILAFPIKMLLLDGEVAGYAWNVLRVLLPAWLIVVLVVFAARRRWRPVTVVLDVLPLIAGHRRARAVADLAFVLEAQLMAGIRLDVAWLQGVIACGDRRLEPIAIEVAETVQRGQPVSGVIVGRRELPPPFAEFWTNGEMTGRLDQALTFLHRHFADIAAKKLTAAGLLYPKLLFAAIAVWVAIHAIQFYADYFKQFDQFM